MDKLCKYLDRELEEYENKVANGGKLSRTEIEDGKNIAKFKMALLTNEAMEKDGYSNRYYEPSYGRKRDAMGRYSRDSFIDELHALHDKAPDEKHKRAIRRMIEDMELDKG